MKSFHLTWLLYNKHLYEKLVYMDKKIQHSMSTMIDLLQPSNDDNNDYSPAEYTQLLNRFLAFDEEMSEIACLYKDSQMKMNSLSKNRNQMGIIVKTTKKKVCKKTKRIKNTLGLTKESLTTNAVDIPISTNSSIIPTVCQQGSNGSSISSGIGGKESSSISSFDEYLLDTNTYTKEEPDRLIQNNNEIHEDKQKKSKSHRRKEKSTKISLTPDLILPPKPPSKSTGSKFQADFRPLTIPLLTKTEIPSCPSLLSAKIQSVSFTAGTFGSITTNESSNNHTRLNLNLSHRSNLPSIKTDSTIAYNNLDQLLRQAASPDEISALLASLEASKSTDELQKSLLHDKNCDFCCCDLFPESNSSTPNACVACMSLPNPTTITCAFNPRAVEVKERLQLKLTKRIIQNPSEQSNTSTGNKTKTKPCDNNIDDLVRFIDGDEPTPKKNKKKKDKQIKISEDTNQKKQNKSTSKEPIVDNVQPLSKRKQKAKLKLEQQEKQDEQSLAIKPSTPPPLEKSDPIPTPIDRSSENSIPPEEEVNWITISRKQTKHKPSPTQVPSLLAAPVVPPNNTKQKKQKPNPKTKNANTTTLAQQKVILETVSNSNKQQHTTNVPAPPPRVQNPVKNQKIEPPSAWVTHEQTQGMQFLFITLYTITDLFSDTTINSSCNNTSFCSIVFSFKIKSN